MNVKSVEKLEKSQVAVTVEVTAEEFEAAVQKAYLKMRNKISVPGFRPGKAPRKMIEKLYGEGVFYSDAVDAALPDAYTQAIGSSGLDVVGYPEVEIVDDQIGKDGLIGIRRTLLLQLEPAAACAHLRRGGQKDLHIGIRQNDRADVAPVHDDASLARDIALHLE